MAGAVVVNDKRVSEHVEVEGVIGGPRASAAYVLIVHHPHMLADGRTEHWVRRDRVRRVVDPGASGAAKGQASSQTGAGNATAAGAAKGGAKGAAKGAAKGGAAAAGVSASNPDSPPDAPPQGSAHPDARMRDLYLHAPW